MSGYAKPSTCDSLASDSDIHPTAGQMWQIMFFLITLAMRNCLNYGTYKPQVKCLIYCLLSHCSSQWKCFVFSFPSRYDLECDLYAATLLPLSIRNHSCLSCNSLPYKSVLMIAFSVPWLSNSPFVLQKTGVIIKLFFFFLRLPRRKKTYCH